MLESNGGISSLSLDGNAIRGESEIVILQAALRADATPGTGDFRPTSPQMANDGSSDGRGTVGRLELNGRGATIGGARNVAVDIEGEVGAISFHVMASRVLRISSTSSSASAATSTPIFTCASICTCTSISTSIVYFIHLFIYIYINSFPYQTGALCSRK